MQRTLALDSPDPSGVELAIPGIHLRYWRTFFTASEADNYLNSLIRTLPWQQDTLNFGGKQVQVPRLQAWFGDNTSLYAYSGLTLRPRPWTDVLLAIKQRIEQSTACHFNAVLANYYRNGNDSVAWHSDNEPELGPDPLVASVSFGINRRFELKHGKDKSRPPVKLELEHGSLLLMGTGVQKKFQHRVPKQPGIAEPRINLTFRYIYSSKGDRQHQSGGLSFND